MTVAVPLYKWLNGREATHVPGFRYRLKVWTPDVEGPLVACGNGYHLNREQDLLGWIGRDLFVAEARGDMLDAGDKIVVRSCRIVEHLTGWNDRTARLFAADCAERVLPLFEAKYPDDDRPRRAVEASRDFANGLIGTAARHAARDAARDAAWDAALDAAGAAAGAAAWAAARHAARDAAWAAAGDAARDAAWAAAWAAAGAAEYEWQTARLLDYAHGRAA